MSLYRGEKLISEMRVGKTIMTEFSAQEKTVNPTKLTQVVTPDDEYDTLSKVTVNPISSDYVHKDSAGDALASHVVAGQTFTSAPAGINAVGTLTVTDLLPDRSEPADAAQIMKGYQGIGASGEIVRGTLEVQRFEIIETAYHSFRAGTMGGQVDMVIYHTLDSVSDFYSCPVEEISVGDYYTAAALNYYTTSNCWTNYVAVGDWMSCQRSNDMLANTFGDGSITFSTTSSYNLRIPASKFILFE